MLVIVNSSECVNMTNILYIGQKCNLRCTIISYRKHTLYEHPHIACVGFHVIALYLIQNPWAFTGGGVST